MRTRALFLTIALVFTGGGPSFFHVFAQTPTPTVVDSPTVKVLTGLLAPEFQEEMNHMVQALGVACGTCHVPGSGGADPRADHEDDRDLQRRSRRETRSGFCRRTGRSRDPGAPLRSSRSQVCRTALSRTLEGGALTSSIAWRLRLMKRRAGPSWAEPVRPVLRSKLSRAPMHQRAGSPPRDRCLLGCGGT